MDYTALQQQAQQQSAQARQQGQQAYQSDIDTANQYKSQYDTAQQQAGQAQQQVSQYSDYLKGAGSGQNIYNQNVGQQMQQAGYDPQLMQSYMQGARQLQGLMGGLNQSYEAGSGTNLGGMSASQAAAYKQAQLAPVQQGLQSTAANVSAMNQAYQNALTGTQNITGAQLKSQEDVQTQLQNNYLDAANQAKSYQDSMNAYQDLAIRQGGLNQSQAEGYAKIIQGYQDSMTAAAQAASAYAQADLYGKQAAALQQGINAGNQQNSNAMFAAMQPTSTTPTTAGTAKPNSPISNIAKNQTAQNLAGSTAGYGLGSLFGPLGGAIGGTLGSTGIGKRVLSDVAGGIGNLFGMK